LDRRLQRRFDDRTGRREKRMDLTLDCFNHRLATVAGELALCFVVTFAGCGGGGAQQGQGLWVANGTNVVEFTPAQTRASMTTPAPAPHLALNSAVFGAPQGVLFDGAGALWVIDGGTVATGGSVAPALQKFTAAQLAALNTTGSPLPSVTIAPGVFKFPQQAVFDIQGQLWVSDNGANAVYVFTAQQLAASSTTLTPAITITSNPAFNGPLGIAFDAQGNLYVANNATTTIFKFKAGTLPSGAGAFEAAPDVVLSDDGQGSIQGPWALAFDFAGNLWSSNANAPDTVVQFASNSLGATGAPTPAVTLAPTSVGGNASLVAPNGIGFDSHGDLATISANAPFGAALFSARQLVAGGAVAPASLLVGAATTLNAPAGCIFGPEVD
jgi:sugar lactone lactonase YvrE